MGSLTTRRAESKTGTLRPDNRSEETSSTIGGLEHVDMRLSSLSPNPLFKWSEADLRVFPCETSPFLGADSMISDLLPSKHRSDLTRKQ